MKTLVKVLALVAIVMFSGYNVHKAQQCEVVSDVAMANVEALADDTENSKKYKYVFYKEPGDPGYGEVKCVCSGENGELPCC